MYIPRAFEETRVPVLHSLIRSRPFCSLVTMGTSGLFASHLPLVLEVPGFEAQTGEEHSGSLGILRGHLSRANAQWKEFVPDVQALAIFSGPHHYITPNWYAEKQVTGRVVPTWNYAVVHAYGFLRIVEDLDWLRSHVSNLTDLHEASSPEPWQVSDAPEDYIRSQLKGIVGLELRIERLEGKWKANQNRSDADRRGVAAGLDELNTSASQAMRELMRKTWEE